jgi:hypothetical protein
MKVGELLVESRVSKIIPWKVTPVDVKKGIQLLNRHCSASLEDIKTGQIMMRAMKLEGGDRISVVDSTKSLRTSRDTNNLYQLGMDVSTAMAGYPSRSRSFICGGGLDVVSSGKKYIMIPFDDTTVAVSGVDDFITQNVSTVDERLEWISESLDILFLARFGIAPDKGDKYIDARRLDKSLASATVPEVVYALADALESAPIADRRKIETAYDNAVKKTSRIEHQLSTFSIMDNTIDLPLLRQAVISNLQPLGKKLWAELTNAPSKKFTTLSSLIFTPKALDVKLQKPGKLKVYGCECWFSGRAIAIEKNTFRDILRELVKQGRKVGFNLLDDLDVDDHDD